MFKMISRHTVWIFIFIMVIMGYTSSIWEQKLPTSLDNDGDFEQENMLESAVENDWVDETEGEIHECTEILSSEIHGITTEATSPVVTVTSIDVFSEYILSRDRTRSKTMSDLEKIIDSQKYSEEINRQAEEALLDMVLKYNNELKIEALLKTYGINNSIAIINEDRVSVIIDMEITDTSQLYKISSIVTNVTGIPREKVTITEY